MDEWIGAGLGLGYAEVAKPIIDLAVGLTAADDLGHVVATLEADGWIYRGDAGTTSSYFAGTIDEAAV